MVFCALIVLSLSPSAQAQYVRRFTTISNGAVTFTGNTLGLDSEPDQNGQGTSGSIGTFITTNTGSRDITPLPTTAPQFPFGTTSDWRQNGSQAVLRLPAGARVLRAELGAATLVFLAISTLASVVPVRRATAVNPVVVLRVE